MVSHKRLTSSIDQVFIGTFRHALSLQRMDILSRGGGRLRLVVIPRFLPCLSPASLERLDLLRMKGV